MHFIEKSEGGLLVPRRQRRNEPRTEEMGQGREKSIREKQLHTGL